MPGKYLKGAFVQFIPTFLIPRPNVVVFQYNPEAITHTWTPAAPETTPSVNSRPNPLAVNSLPGRELLLHADDGLLRHNRGRKRRDRGHSRGNRALFPARGS